MHDIYPPTLERKAAANARGSRKASTDFDHERFPIIARHWFGWRSVGEIAARDVERLRRQRARAAT